MRHFVLKKTAALIALGSVIAFLGGCSCDPKTKVVVIEPEAVIASTVYVRTPASAGMPLEYGGAALRDENYAYTLNDCEFCPDGSSCKGALTAQKIEESQTQTAAVATSGAKAEQTVPQTTKKVVKKKTIRRKAKAKAQTTVKPKKEIKPEDIDCELYKKYCEPKQKNISLSESQKSVLLR